MIVGKQLYPISTSFSTITRMRDQLDQLSQQLASQKQYQTLADMGSDRVLDINLRQRLNRLEAFQSNIDNVNLRLDVLDDSVSRLSKINLEALSTARESNYGEAGINMATGPALAEARLDEVLSLLSSEVGGRYLYGGNITDQDPVASLSQVLDGSGGKAGFKTVATERLAADRGADGMGRLVLSTTASDVTLGEDGVHPFGMKLSTVSTTASGINLTQPAGAPQTLGVSFVLQPNAGDTITIGLTMPDGTEAALKLTATSGTPGAGEFAIGANSDETATNFAAALQQGLLTMGDTELRSASTGAAAANFFNGQGESVMRVDGPPFETATGLVAATDANTMMWYSGSDVADPRGSVSTRVSETSSVDYGVQANESGLVSLVRSLAALAVSTFDVNDSTAEGRFDALMAKQRTDLAANAGAQAGSIDVLAVELGAARSSAGAAADRQDTYTAQLQTMLDEIEAAPIEEVAMKLLAVKTRLEASYSALATISDLTLVNYM